MQTRAQFVARGFGAVATLAFAARPGLARAAAADAPTLPAGYRTRPDLVPPGVVVDQAAAGRAGGYILLAPFTGQANGTAAIVDDRGEPVWLHQSPKLIMNFRVQTFHGAPVLTWWEGSVEDSLFAGECVIADERYTEIARFSAGNGFVPEVHEFLLTAKDTALISANNIVRKDLTAWGGPDDSYLVENVVQELDVDTGEVLFEWHSLDHVDPSESLVPVGPAWDYFHLNSIDVDPADGNLVLSARHPCAVYKIDHTSGDVIWRLGGTKSDFTLGDDATFYFQHDARVQPGDTLSVFDDGANDPTDPREPVSRALLLQLDTTAMTAEVVSSNLNPSGLLTIAMGNAQRLGTGGTLVGWGTVPQITEFAADGSVVFNATFPAGRSSYRAFRGQWRGRAPGLPIVAAEPAGSGLTVYASWNGSTRVAAWQILGGASPKALSPVLTQPRSGFETAVAIRRRPAYVAAAALDARGAEVGRSPAIKT